MSYADLANNCVCLWITVAQKHKHGSLSEACTYDSYNYYIVSLAMPPVYMAMEIQSGMLG